MQCYTVSIASTFYKHVYPLDVKHRLIIYPVTCYKLRYSDVGISFCGFIVDANLLLLLLMAAIIRDY